jgi:hypothetical protein
MKVSREQLVDWMRDNDVTLSDILDIFIELNAIIGVGLISLGDRLQQYCYHWKERNGQ